MPWKRKKLPRGSSNIIIQKRWFRFWFFGWHDFSSTFSEMSTPINQAKAKCVEMERMITKMKAEIQNAEREYKVEVKAMKEKITGRDTDGGVITQWKWERNPWYKLSLFQWGVAYVDEPLAYDSRTYSSGGSRHDRPRSKSADIAANTFGQELDEFKDQVRDDAKDKSGKYDELLYWECGKEEITQKDKQQKKGETEEKYKERMEKMEGKLTK